jgi:NAD(P)-dependent dehydrogenase (short-subunit alcohol dehydrogenase family)
MSKYWAGRRVLVTGSTRGIGEATVRHLAGLGASVVVHGRDAVQGMALAAELASGGGSGRGAVFVAADLEQPDEPARLVDAAWDALGGLDALVNNAGANRFHGVMGTTLAQFDECLALDLRAYWFASSRFAERAGARGGAIVNVSSNHAT